MARSSLHRLRLYAGLSARTDRKNGHIEANDLRILALRACGDANVPLNVLPRRLQLGNLRAHSLTPTETASSLAASSLIRLRMAVRGALVATGRMSSGVATLAGWVAGAGRVGLVRAGGGAEDAVALVPGLAAAGGALVWAGRLLAASIRAKIAL